MTQAGPVLWQYLSSAQRELAEDGETLIADRLAHPTERLSDYSYLVFPFAKLYEGFLKQLFLDLRIIQERDYHSDHFRIGKALSPNLAKLLGARSAYAWVSRQYSPELALRLWTTWKEGRNLVFHYFPHNIRRLSFEDAQRVAESIIATMREAVIATGVSSHKT